MFYQPRRPERSPCHAVLNQFFDRFSREYELRFERSYGPMRSIVPKTVERLLGCGLPQGGFVRVRCDACRAIYFVAFSCKQREFCLSCSAKRATLWAEFARGQVIRDVPHRHFVFALPKALRSAFRHRRSQLPKLALCVWKSVAAHIRADADGETLPGAIVSIQTAENFPYRHPNLRVLATAGAFTFDGNFLRAPHVDIAALRELFQAHVIRCLLKEQMISPELVDRMRTWGHSGFHAFAGDLIPGIDKAARVGINMVRGPAASNRLRIDAEQEPKLRSWGGGQDTYNSLT